MNLNLIPPKNKTEDLLLSVTRNCETLIEKTHRKPEETLEFKLKNSRKAFHFNPPIQIEGSGMIGLTSLETYNSSFEITEENNKLVFYTERLDSEFSYTELKDKAAEMLGRSDISSEDLALEILGPDNIQIYRKLSTEKSQIEGFYILLKSYLQTPFRDFESYLRILTGLNEDDIRLILKQYNSNFKTYQVSPGAYTLNIFLKFFREVLKQNLKSEIDSDQNLNMINPIQFSSIVITLAR